MRELKFRAWYDKSQTWVYFTFNQPMTDVAKAIHQNICLNGGVFYQFTGLLDKNGKEIYEGDVIQDTYQASVIGKVIFENGAFRIEYKGGNGVYDISDRIYYEPEIIGNIHENPELIKN